MADGKELLADIAGRGKALKDAAANTDVGVKKKAVAAKQEVEKAKADGGPTMKPGEKVSDYMVRVKAWAGGK